MLVWTVAVMLSAPSDTGQLDDLSPWMMVLMNMAGVVAYPKRATFTPLLVSPAANAAASKGPLILGSLPICKHHMANIGFERMFHCK